MSWRNFDKTDNCPEDSKSSWNTECYGFWLYYHISYTCVVWLTKLTQYININDINIYKIYKTITFSVSARLWIFTCLWQIQTNKQLCVWKRTNIMS
jgi:hypothetical protein